MQKRNTKTKTYTDADGQFSTATSGKSLLVQIFSLGYKTLLEILSFKEKIYTIYGTVCSQIAGDDRIGQ
jgi:hypothetical protein